MDVLYSRDLRDQFLRFKTKTEQVLQSHQARPKLRLKRYSLNKRDRDSYSRIFETETKTETRKCVFFGLRPRVSRISVIYTYNFTIQDFVLHQFVRVISRFLVIFGTLLLNRAMFL